MACEIPVIGSASGEIPAVIGEAGIVFPEGDPSALAERIASLAENPARRADLAARGRARALAHFTHKQIAAETFRVYRQMLTGQASPASARCPENP
jgi:glycosyltransferase involved in cell wall biosynthesis